MAHTPSVLNDLSAKKALKLRSNLGRKGGKNSVQILNKYANNGSLIISGVSLSMLGILGFVLNRALHTLKGRKVAHMSRYHYRSMICAPANANGVAPAKAKKVKREEAERPLTCEEDTHDSIPVHSTAKRSVRVMGFARIGGRLKHPPMDDQFVYLDE